MPDNNRKVIYESLISKLNDTYKFSYDKTDNTIIVSLATCKRITKHDANKAFLLNAKKFKKKFVFSIIDINIFKAFQENKRLSKFSLFDIHNAINKLKSMYQIVDTNSVADILLSDFNGIKRIY